MPLWNLFQNISCLNSTLPLSNVSEEDLVSNNASSATFPTHARWQLSALFQLPAFYCHCKLRFWVIILGWYAFGFISSRDFDVTSHLHPRVLRFYTAHYLDMFVHRYMIICIRRNLYKHTVEHEKEQTVSCRTADFAEAVANVCVMGILGSLWSSVEDFMFWGFLYFVMGWRWWGSFSFIMPVLLLIFQWLKIWIFPEPL